MADRPILFSAPMIRALLAGTKTQTRRVVKGERACRGPEDGWHLKPYGFVTHQQLAKAACPYGVPGDRLWVREAWKAHTTFDHLPPRDIPRTHVWYMADDGYKAESRTRPGMFMPRWVSRITLEITAVRVERLQDISEEDARAEGIAPIEGSRQMQGPNHFSVVEVGGWANFPTAQDAYRHLWESINGAGSWGANPWVWCVTFRRVAP